jgi:HSP20 family protein
MKLIKYDPLWNEPYSEMNTLLERVFGDRFGPALGGWPFGGAESYTPRLDLYRSAEGYQVVMELPGLPKEAVEVKLENAVLTVSGEHKSGDGEQQRQRRFSRSITVGDDIAADKVTAKLENGLLTISLPKLDERKPRAITVD